jgi:putative ABC transport system substrate-binding protein
MNRRQLVTSLAATTLVLPGALLAQSPQLRRIGVMMAIAETDPEGLHRVETFRRSLADEGWVDGQTVAIETRWYRGNFQIAQDLAKDLVDRGVEILMVNGTPGMDAVRALGTSIPVIFVVVSNPVGAGYVPNLSRPGGNVTGFSTFEPEIAGKWLQLLSQIVPKLKNVNMLLDPKFIGFNSLWRALEEIAPTHGVTPHAAFASSLPEI